MSYRLATAEMLLVVLAMMLVFATITFNPDHIDVWTRQTKWIVAGGVAWLFGGNYLVGLIRFPIWLRAGLLRTMPTEG